MKKISRKEFLKKDVYIMYRSTTERTSVLKLIEDNLKSVKWSLTEEKPTEINANEVFVKNPSMGFINIKEEYIYIPTYFSANDENKLLLTYSEFVDIVNSFNTELLTGYEKQYITDIIKASRLKVDYVVKKSAESTYDLIRFEEDGDGVTTLYLYAIATLEDLDEGEKYTLDELGIDIYDEKEEHKITLSEFFKSRDLKAIHCKNVDQVKKLYAASDKLYEKGMTGGRRLEELGIDATYRFYKYQTAYTNNGNYGYIYDLEDDGVEIYEFKDVDLDN